MLRSMFICSVLCIAACAIVTRAANILAFMPLPIKSHFRGFQPLFEELAHRGHNVTVASSFPLDRPIVNYTDIGPFVNKERVRNVMDLVHMNFVTSVKVKWELGIRFSDVIMSHGNMKKFVQSNSNSFDLVMIETFSQEYTIAMGHKFNAPVINLAPSMPWVSISKWLHNPSTFSYIPDVCMKSTGDMGFVNRLKNTITGLMQSYVENYFYLPKMKEAMNKHFKYEGWESRPPLEHMLKNVSLTLVNSNYAIGVPRPYLPGIVEVGGMHLTTPKSLPENLQTFLDFADEGVIFFSFGTLVNLNDLPKEKLNIFLSVIQKLKQKIILKWIPPNDSVKLSENIMTGSWFPQNDILAHPNVRLFITHGGLHSIEETISNAIPIVGIPFFADQYLNMKIAEEKGYGKLVNFFEMTEELFENAIKEVLSNVMYKEMVKIQSQIFKDQPMKPLDRAVYWVEYVIRNGGAKHLISDSSELNETFLSPPATLAANILAFMPMPLKSHFGGFQPMFEELARRGHNVTVVSSFPLANRSVPNYTDVDVTPVQGLPDIDVMQLININFLMTVTNRWFFANLLSAQMEHANLIDFLRSEDNSFDLVIVESFLQEYTVAIGHKYNAPVVNLSPGMVWVSISRWLHLPSTFSYVPDCCIGITDDMSFTDRLKNTIVGFVQMFVEDYLYIPMMKAKMSKHFTYVGSESRPTLEQMLNNVSLTLMNAYHAVGVCRPYLQGVVEVGGMHLKEPKPLPKDLQDYIDSASNGVIYFSFGSIVNLSNLPKEKLSSFLNAISRLKQKVIIKWVPDKSIKLPQNVKVGSWLPQNDILAHPNVKLFITHGGLHSIEEAVYNEKPVIGIPFFADQISNMRRVEKIGYGKLITFDQLTEESFGNAVEEVISNPAFKDKAMIQSQVFRDQPMKPLDRAIYWIEYVIRNGGAQYLKAGSIGLNTAQYFLFDVTLFLLLSIAIVAWLGYCGIVKVSSKFKAD